MSILSSLNIDFQFVLLNLAGFLVLLFVARGMVFAPIGRVIDEREKEINATYDKLDADQREMKELKSEYETRLTAIEAEARERIQTAIREAQAARDQIVSDANTRSREIITRAEQEANREKEQAMITLRQQIVDMALGAATKVIGEGLDTSRQKKLIDDFIATGVAPTATSTTAETPAQA